MNLESIAENSDQDFFMKSVNLDTSPQCNICLCEIEKDEEVWTCTKCHNTQHFECFSHCVQTNNNRKCVICQVKIQGSIKKTCYCGHRAITHHLLDTPGNVFVCEKICGRRITEREENCQRPCHFGPCKEFQKAPIIECEIPKILHEKGRCSNLRNCGQHHCKELSHQGACNNCEVELTIDCRCGITYTKICGSDTACKTICNKVLNCRKHQCKELCHEGDCKPCANYNLYCDCTRTFEHFDCISDIPKNGSRCKFRCNVVLDCGNHKCTEVCHSGDCKPCTVIETTTCQYCIRDIKIECGKEKVCQECVPRN